MNAIKIISDLNKSWHDKRNFLLLLALTFLTQWPLLVRDVWPLAGDAFFFQKIFYTFYNHFFFHGELARWIPSEPFGFPAQAWQLIGLTPTGYLSGFLGAVLRIQNTFLVYKLSVLLEVGIFLGGTYALSGKLFRHQSSVFWTCLGTVTTSLWAVQVSLNLHFLYLLPSVFCLLIRFFEEKRPHYFWQAGLMMVFAQLGQPPSSGLAHLMLVFLLLAVMCIRKRSSLKCFREKSRVHFCSISVFFICLGAYLLFSCHALYFLLHLPELSGKNSLALEVLSQNLPSYGSSGISVSGIKKWLELFFPDLRNLVCPVYAGFFSLVFILYGIIHARNKKFMAAAGMVVISLILVMISEVIVATQSSRPPALFCRLFLPGGQMISFVRLCLCFLAGSGLDQFLDDLEARKKNTVRFDPAQRLLGYAMSLVVVWVILSNQIFVQRNYFETKVAEPTGRTPIVNQDFYGLYLVLTTLALLLIQKTKSVRKAGMIVCCFFALEMLSYHNAFIAKKYESWPKADKTMTHISKDFTAMLFGPPGAQKIIMPNPDTFTIGAFTLNQLLINVEVLNPEGSNLEDVDAYHAGWKAYVDGRRTDMIRAHPAILGTLRLPHGPHDVRLIFWEGLQSLCNILIALGGVLFSGAMIYISILKPFFEAPKP
jgi:hypothetical protein